MNATPSLSPAEQLDRLSRERWSEIIAVTLIQQGQLTVLSIIGGGEDLFLKRMQAEYGHQHDLEMSDFSRIFHRLIRSALKSGWIQMRQGQGN